MEEKERIGEERGSYSGSEGTGRVGASAVRTDGRAYGLADIPFHLTAFSATFDQTELKLATELSPTFCQPVWLDLPGGRGRRTLQVGVPIAGPAIRVRAGWACARPLALIARLPSPIHHIKSPVTLQLDRFHSPPLPLSSSPAVYGLLLSHLLALG